MLGLQDDAAPWGQLSGYLLRARALLRPDRSPEEVRWGGVAVSWMLNEALPKLHDRSEEARPPPIVPITPSIVALVRLRQHFSIHGMAYFPDASWPELLAAYAISCIGQAHVAFQKKRESTALALESQNELARDLDRKFLAEVLEAAEAVQQAESIEVGRVEVADEVERLFTERQRDKAIKRHAKQRAIIEEFFAFYIGKGGGNQSHAASTFLRHLSPEERREFTANEENAVRTLTRNLRTFLRGQTSDEDDA